MKCSDCGCGVSSPYYVNPSLPVCPDCMERRVRASVHELHDAWESEDEQQRQEVEEEGYWETVFLDPDVSEGTVPGSQPSESQNTEHIRKQSSPRRRRRRRNR